MNIYGLVEEMERELAETAERNGHVLQPWVRERDEIGAHTSCRICGASVAFALAEAPAGEPPAGLRVIAEETASLCSSERS